MAARQCRGAASCREDVAHNATLLGFWGSREPGFPPLEVARKQLIGARNLVGDCGPDFSSARPEEGINLSRGGGQGAIRPLNAF